MTDSMRDRIAQAACGATSAGKLFPWNTLSEAQRDSWRRMADAVIAELQPELDRHNTGCVVCNECWRDQPSYADNFCRGGCDCSCCYGMADEPCHCRDAVCNCGGDRAAHGQKPLEGK